MSIQKIFTSESMPALLEKYKSSDNSSREANLAKKALFRTLSQPNLFNIPPPLRHPWGDELDRIYLQTNAQKLESHVEEINTPESEKVCIDLFNLADEKQKKRTVEGDTIIIDKHPKKEPQFIKSIERGPLAGAKTIVTNKKWQQRISVSNIIILSLFAAAILMSFGIIFRQQIGNAFSLLLKKM